MSIRKTWLGFIALTAMGFHCFESAVAVTPLATTYVAGGFTHPVFVTHAPGDFNRLFVVEQPGRIRIIKNGSTLFTPFLDATSLVSPGGLEYGLLMIAFHPNYQSNGIFYTYYTVPSGNADPVVSRWHVSADPDVARFASRVTILHIPYTISSHRAGWMDFGPDGYLYITTGDGGETDPQNNASNLSVLKGKILRIDVNGPDGIPDTADDDGFPLDPDRNYRIPADNPFLSTPGAAPELWAYGLRNPWRGGFDRLTHDLWIGDVGQNAREEIDFQPTRIGGSFYGWKCIEGTVPTNYAGCPLPLPPSVLPVHEYSHSVGSAVIGGYVYRGCAIPELNGTYLFGDWSGKCFSFRYSQLVGVTEFADRTAELGLGSSITSSFGEDAYGELYACLWGAGEVRKIVPQTFVGPDCNANNRNDACDILAGISHDANHNGVPDECDPPPPACPADIAPPGSPPGNGWVNVDDLLEVINHWGQCRAPCPADIAPRPNGNGFVNVDDLLAVINQWGACP